jgi:hypothetical protein
MNVDDGDVRVVGCVFVGVEVDDGNGSVINAVVNDGKRVDIIGLSCLYIFFFVVVLDYCCLF